MIWGAEVGFYMKLVPTFWRLQNKEIKKKQRLLQYKITTEFKMESEHYLMDFSRTKVVNNIGL